MRAAHLSTKAFSLWFVLFTFTLLIGNSAHAQSGIAQKYTRDIGIEKDPAVILSEKFEDSVSAISSRWSQTQNGAGMSLTTDVPASSGGTRSLRMTSVGGSNSGGHIYKNLASINPVGYGQLYVRYYVKYASSGDRSHSGGWVGGQNPASNFLFSTCCNRPTGTNFFYSGALPLNEQFDLYTDWMEMKISPDNVNYYGNSFIHNPKFALTRNQWHVVEVMLKMNNPTTGRNGELRAWLNGIEVIHLAEGSPLGSWNQNIWTTSAGNTPFEGFRWRSTSALNLNFVWLLHYANDPSGFVGSVWYDDLVVATSYIGPLNTTATLDTPAAPTNLTVK